MSEGVVWDTMGAGRAARMVVVTTPNAYTDSASSGGISLLVGGVGAMPLLVWPGFAAETWPDNQCNDDGLCD